MNKIEKLIKQYCPDGVEHKELGEIILSLKTGLNPRKNFTLNTVDAKNFYVTVRELSGLDVTFFDKTDRVNDDGLRLIIKRSNLEKGDVLFSGTGTIGRTALVKENPENWGVKEGVYVIKPNQNLVLPLFILYVLHSSAVARLIQNKVVGSPVCSVPMAELKKISIPVPPLPIQHEIVSILNKFTALEAELEAELEARTRQHEYYRSQLLNFNNREVEWKKIGEVGEIRRGVAFTRKQSVLGKYPVIANAPIPISYHNEANRSGECIVVARSGANAGLISYWNEKLFLTDAFSIHPNKALLKTKFIYYYLKNLQREIHLMKEGSGVPHVRASDFEIYNVPIPTIKEQERIVKILDQFDALVNDISIGLPAEIKARRQQYEYYRSKLLTFKNVNQDEPIQGNR